MRRGVQMGGLLVLLLCVLLLRRNGDPEQQRPVAPGDNAAQRPGSQDRLNDWQRIAPQDPKSYLARLEKGLSEEEIGWIVRDFQSLGLDVEPGEGATEEWRALRMKQIGWYLGALTEGLGLTEEQEAEARRRLEGIARADMELGPENHIARNNAEEHSPWGSSLTSANAWLANEANAPWNLCELGEEQLAITWHSFLMECRANPESLIFEQGKNWLGLGGAAQSFSESGRSGRLGDFSTGDAPTFISEGGAIFPLADVQGYQGADHTSRPVPAAHGVKQVKSLHPAQLKMLLLLVPGHASEIRVALDSAEAR